jgi:hypothetical protein
MQANRYSTPLILLAGLLLAATQAHAISLPLSSATPPIGLSSSGNSYAEVGDAGDRFDPQDVTGTGISQITGTIGPDFLPGSLDTSIALNGVDLVDAFRETRKMR